MPAGLSWALSKRTGRSYHHTTKHPFRPANYRQVLPPTRRVRRARRRLAPDRQPDRLLPHQHHDLVRHGGEPLQQRRLGRVHGEQEPHPQDPLRQQHRQQHHDGRRLPPEVSPPSPSKNPPSNPIQAGSPTSSTSTTQTTTPPPAPAPSAPSSPAQPSAPTAPSAPAPRSPKPTTSPGSCSATTTSCSGRRATTAATTSCRSRPRPCRRRTSACRT